MSRLRGPTQWLDRLGLSRPKAEDSVAWEVEHHIAELADRLVDEGWEEDAAKREAARRFGDPARYAVSMRRLERERETMERRIRGWDVVREGVMSVVRTTRRYPGFTVGVVLTLGLGIGANATMYGIVDRLLLQPPEHIANHERVKLVYYERPSFMTGEPTVGSTLTYPDFTDLEAHDGVEVAAYTWARPSTVGRGQDATQVQSALVSAEFFPLLGVQPRVGRFFGEDEDEVGGPLVAVISEEYWTRAFGADPNVLGQALEIEGRRTTIIGVAPRGFTGTNLASVDVWLPIVPTHAAQRGDFCLTSRGCWWMQMVARLHDDVSVEAAEAQATALHLAGRREMIDADRYSEEARVVLGPVIAADGPEASDEARVARWLAAVSAIVLLIAARTWRTCSWLAACDSGVRPE